VKTRALFSTGLAAVFLAGCVGTSTRSGPPAPVYNRGMPGADGAQVSAVEEPQLETGEGLGLAYDPDAIDTSVPDAPTRAPRAEVATTAPAGQEAATGQQIAYAAPASASSSKPVGNAASSLLEKAESQRRSGDLDGAASTLERAVRIESRHPLPWNRLAQIRLQQQNYSLATELASKSNALAGSDRGLKRSNYLIIADAKRATGDVAGARVAQSRADSLR
jgi:tetratricopeptide (TPR) repeat protein